MKQLKNSWLPGMASIMLGLLVLAGAVVYIMLPWIVEIYIKGADVTLAPDSYKVMLTLLYCVGIPVMALLVLAFLLTLNITRGKTFVHQNTRYLNTISICAVISGFIFFIGMFFLHSIFPIVIFTIFILLAIITKVFADLFRTAIEYKEENDLTI